MARPRRPPITRDAIFRTALRIVDEHGPDALSTNRIAAELGVKGPSLYNHVSGRTEIIEGIRELVTAEIDFTVLDLHPWQRALEHLARSYRAAFAAHPRVVPLLTAHPVRSAAVLALYDRVSAALRQAGFPDEDLSPIIQAVEYLIIGSALDQAAPTGGDPRHAFEVGLSLLVRGLTDRLTAPRPQAAN